MLDKPLRVIFTILSTLSILFNSVAHVSAATYHGDNELYQAANHRLPTLAATLPDPDFDGISTTDETNGWFNEKGGPYVTDPNNPDSDNDGLSDGEEQLFDTDPTDPKSPGMFVEYTDALHTAKYFVWQKHGGKYIANPEDQSRDGVIVRRGTEFVVNGPPDATLTIEKSKDGLTTLTPQKHACGAGWRIKIPSNSDVGIYTLKMDRNGWNKPVTMPLYVIFEIPDPVNGSTPPYTLNEAAITTALYNDDPNDIRDENTIWWGGSDNSPLTLSRFRSIAFPTDQYKAYVFEEHVMGAINGKPNQAEAANAILNRVDAVTRFNPSKNRYSMKEALFAPNKTNQCSNIANVATGFLRSAGIPARTMNVDWDGEVVGSGVFDHATQLWLSNQWKTARGYNVSSSGSQYNSDLGGESCDGVDSIQCGIVPPRTIDKWKSKHPESIADIIYTAPDDWSWSTTGDEADKDGPYGYGLDYIWKKTPSSTRKVPSEGQFNPGSVETWTRWYWNWPSEPAITGPAEDPPWSGCPGRPCKEGGQTGDGDDSKGDGTEGASVEPLLTSSDESNQNSVVSIGEIQSSYGLDTDGNGRFDQLLVELGVTVNQPGSYTIGATLDSPNFETENKLGAIAAAVVFDDFEAGPQIVKFAFDGTTIAEQDAAGPFTLVDAWVATAPVNADPVEIAESVVSRKAEVGYVSYQSPTTGQIGGASTAASDDFDNWGAELTTLYNHNAQDTNQDGLFDRLVVDTTIEVTDPGEYRVEAELVDSSGETVAEASWSGPGPNVSLVFDALLSDPRPYQVKNVRLYNAAGEIIDSNLDGSPTGGTSYFVGPLYNTGISALAASSGTEVTAATPIDSDGDGDFDSLQFSVDTNIPVAGNYRLEGWLEGNSGGLIVWQTGNVVSLTEGVQSLTLSFDGQAIKAFKANGPYKLTALKVSWSFNGSYTTIDEVAEAYTTAAFSFTDFDGNFDSSALIDRLENGPGSLWDVSKTNWALTTEASTSPIHSWTDSPNSRYGPEDTQLTTKAFVVSHGAAPLVSFQSCYDINQDGDQGKLQVSVNGGEWTTAKTYDGSTNGWTLEQVPAGAPIIGADSNVTIRFLMNTNSDNHADGWFIDDVSITFDYDLDDDGLPNDVEIDGNPNNPPDTDNDQIPDYLDDDADGDGIPDANEGLTDTDGDNIPNFQDKDADGDGIPDANEGAADTDGDNIPDYQDTDADGDGIADKTEGSSDTDGDGTPNYKDTDTDNDGIPDSVEGNTDSDGDGIPDYKDTDSDNDGINDSDEWSDSDNHDSCTNDAGLDTDGDGIANCKDNDIDGDGIPNYADKDSDGDGIDDKDEVGEPGNPIDTDGDGIPDYLDSDPELNEGPIILTVYLPFINK